MAFTDAMPDLEELLLIDFVVSDEDLNRLAARQPPLRRALLTGRDLAQDQRIRRVLSGRIEDLEIRGCAVHACAAIAQRTGLTERDLDNALWYRGQRPEYKARPRHRCRTVYY